jgi:TonB family protein
VEALHPAVQQSLLVRHKSRIGPFLLGSVAAHAGLVLLGLVLGTFFAAPPLDLDQKPIHATLVRLGKPRDQKLLPRKETPPPPPKEVKGTAAPAPPPAEKAVPIPSAKPTPATAKQSGQKEGEARRKQLFGAFDKFSKAKPDEELEGAENGSLDGDAAKAEGEQYWGLLTAQVRRNYDVSQTIPEDERIHLRARVALRIGRRGQVLKVSLAKSSGNALFDNAVLAAVKKAQPFSPPPDALRDSLEKTGVVLEFVP